MPLVCTQKRCTRCSEVKRKTEFRKWGKGGDGFNQWCKECSNAYNRQWNKSRRVGKQKQCRSCDEVKGIEDFVVNRLGRPGAWCESCRADGRFSYNSEKNQYENRHPAEDGLKRCSKCREAKHVSGFWKCCRRIDGLAGWCKECYRLMANTEEEKRRRRNHTTTRKYGVSADVIDGILLEQESKCAICQDEFPPQRIERSENNGNRCFGGFATDHDHATGKIRGLLCGRCNAMIGQARENVEILRSAIDYLVKHSEQVCSGDE